MDKTIDCMYVVRTDLPGESAHTVHVMKISEELSKIYAGHFCCLVWHKLESNQEICEKYGTQEFDIRQLGMKGGGKLTAWRFAWKASRYVKKCHCKKVITRDPLTAVFAALSGVNVMLDLHGDVKQLCGRGYHLFKIKKLVGRKNIHFIAISEGIKKAYIKEYGVEYEKMHVFPDGVTIENYAGLTQDNVLAKEKIVFGYIGKFSVGKGIDLIAEIAEKCSQHEFCMCGGTREDAEREIGRPFPSNVTFMGYVDNKDVPHIMENMDVMLLPNKADQICNGENIGAYTSPIKMFEYMASGRPLIASDIPVLREVLNEKNCFFAADGNPDDWVGAIEIIENDRGWAKAIASKARADVKKYTWKARAEAMARILR